MQTEHRKISGWGLFPARTAELCVPADSDEAGALLRDPMPLIARGNGRSYGDAALAERVLSTRKWDKILDFDVETGIITCESGVLFANIIPVVLPAGWFFAVTPGTKMLSVGGAIAADVHGKNHPTMGCFSQHLLWFDLMVEGGTVLRCSKTEHPDLFWRTCGGMGWTGIILRAAFQLRRQYSTQMHQRTVRLSGGARFTDFFEAFERHARFEYGAGWLDFSEKKLRGAVFFAEESKAILVKKDPGTGAASSPTKRLGDRLPFAPKGLLNRWSIHAYNALYYATHPSGAGLVDMEKYFYPLDSMGAWNRLYGRRGFVQYQCCLPMQHCAAGYDAIWRCIRDSGERPFLAVLKRHGKRPPEAVNSFPIEGYSLALDFPRTAGVPNLVRDLDALLDRYGGKVYLAKDACSASHLGRVDMTRFSSPKFVSDLKIRLQNG